MLKELRENALKDFDQDEELKRKLKIQDITINGVASFLFPTRSRGLCLYVPQDSRRKIFTLVHNDTLNHKGVNQTVTTILNLGLSWNYLQRDISNMVKECCRCQISKAPITNLMRHGDTLQRTYSFPMETIITDYAGPFPETEEGYRYILVIKDAFTSFARFVPTINKLALTTTEALLNFFAVFGVAQEIQHDGDPSYCNALEEDVARKLGFKIHVTTPYHPASNGAVEALNRYIREYLVAAGDAEAAHWPHHLALIQLSFNTTPYTGTKVPPSNLFLNFEPRRAAEAALFSEGGMDVEKEVKNLLNGQPSYQQRIQQAHDFRKQYLQRISDQLKKNNNNPGFKVKPEDLVLRINFRRIHKLSPYWEGPFRVHRLLGPNTCVIRDITRERTINTHFGHLKKFHRGNMTDEELIREAQRNTEYVIEKVISHEAIDAHNPKTWTFKVKWLAYDVEKDQRLYEFQEISHLKVVKAYVEEELKKIDEKKKKKIKKTGIKKGTKGRAGTCTPTPPVRRSSRIATRS
eukprot:TRINITY_DN2316_c0_g4_i4.p1 TRINITY_DN2316_c0_g4~~TRINITY_DN2316_c0_g4_i4.p1  ORF type:complete len:546 (+),score=66.62 TRINITY_DN2316_c0_g4_i4:76-1638(+)